MSEVLTEAEANSFLYIECENWKRSYLELLKHHDRLKIAVIEMHNDNIKGDFALDKLARLDLDSCMETIALQETSDE
jgi:hypothetical protein